MTRILMVCLTQELVIHHSSDGRVGIFANIFRGRRIVPTRKGVSNLRNPEERVRAVLPGLGLYVHQCLVLRVLSHNVGSLCCGRRLFVVSVSRVSLATFPPLINVDGLSPSFVLCRGRRQYMRSFRILVIVHHEPERHILVRHCL
jgi:hypothetical protein